MYRIVNIEIGPLQLSFAEQDVSLPQGQGLLKCCCLLESRGLVVELQDPCRWLLLQRFH